MVIACVDNISAAAYRATRPSFPVVWVDEPPVGTRTSIARGEVDAALVSVAALPRLAHLVRPIGPYGIACSHRVGSVVYIGRRAPEDAVRHGDRVYLSEQSLTARELFPLLCRLSFGRVPLLTSDPSEAGAHVLIGNEAMMKAHVASHREVVVDLCEWWRDATHLPFVFAQWVVSIGAPERKRRMLRDWLETATRFAESPPGRRRMEEEVQRLGIPRDAATDYYQGIEYRLNQDHMVGMTAFLNMREEEGRWTAIG